MNFINKAAKFTPYIGVALLAISLGIALMFYELTVPVTGEISLSEFYVECLTNAVKYAMLWATSFVLGIKFLFAKPKL